jgi:hypothetical protein
LFIKDKILIFFFEKYGNIKEKKKVGIMKEKLQRKIAEAICENDEIILELTKEESEILQKVLFDLDGLKIGLEKLCVLIEENVEPSSEVSELSNQLYDEFLTENK